MLVHLKKGEKLYVNGAVLRVDRRTSVEFLNDVTFLLENHVMQAEEATTPCRQLYFVVQTMLIDPANAGLTAELYKHLSGRLRDNATDQQIVALLDVADQKIEAGRYFDSLKQLRLAFAIEDGPGACSPASSVEAA